MTRNQTNRIGPDLTWKNLALLNGDGVGGGFLDPLEASIAITQILLEILRPNNQEAKSRWNSIPGSS